jgi:DNA-binding transcriptional regulator YiaG
MSQLVREMRGRIGISQEKFAAKIGVSFPTVSRWEKGRAKPSPLAMQKIEESLRKMGKNGQDLLQEYFPEDRGAEE